MGIGTILLDFFIPFSELFLPIIPGDVFPFFFGQEINGQPVRMFQRSLFATLMVTSMACFLGPFLMIRNLSLIGDGIAHVAFGGIGVALVLGATAPMDYATVFAVTASILIYELQSREIVTGDTAIAIFLTGMLALGLVVLQIWGGGITADIHGYLFGNVLLIGEAELDRITTICLFSLFVLMLIRKGLLAMTIDPLVARIQGIPVHPIGLLFCIITALIVVGMVKLVGALLVTALLVSPAATGQLVARSFRSCLIWSQIFGFCSVLLGLYLSAEMATGSGTMIAVVAASIFGVVLISTNAIKLFLRPNDNF